MILGKNQQKFELLFSRTSISNVGLEDAVKFLESGSSEEKIMALESLANTSDRAVIQKIISSLEDADIRVRGEAFSSLVLNENSILESLTQCLNSESKNIRGYVALILANRKESGAIPDIIKLAWDERSMVRACALGALGHLRAREANAVILQCLDDLNMEVKKSAVKAAIDIGEPLSEGTIRGILQQKDAELERLVTKIKIKK